MKFVSRHRRVLVSLCVPVLVASLLVGRAMATIDGVISFAFQVNDRRTVGLNTTANLPVNTSPSITYTNGSGANQGNVLYQGSLALSSGTFNLDLNGVLTDSYGSTVTLLRVKGIYIKNTDAANTLTVGNGTNPWITLLTGTGTIILPAGAWFAAATPDATGWTVTAATGDILKFAGTGTSTFQVVVLGSSS